MHPLTKKSARTLHGLAIIIMCFVFIGDLEAPMGMTISSVYILVGVISVAFDPPLIVFAYAIGCTLLMLLAMVLRKPADGFGWMQWSNHLVNFGLLWIVTMMGLRLKKAVRQIARHEKELIQVNEELQRISRHDALTGVANRRFFDETLQMELNRAFRQRTSLALIMIDIDYFKAYNDTFGHVQGDTCLVRIAQAIQMNIRRSADLTARYGGEEFAVILPGTTLEGAIGRCQAIQSQIANLKIEHPGSQVSKFVTISIGLYFYSPQDTRIDAQQMTELTDKCLYRAKTLGRNRCEFATNLGLRDQANPELSGSSGLALTEKVQSVVV